MTCAMMTLAIKSPKPKPTPNVDLWDLGQRPQHQKNLALSFHRLFLSGAMILISCFLWSATGRAELTPSKVNKIVDAIYKAEGGKSAKKPYGILSVPCTTEASCRRIAENTVRNNYKRWIKAGKPGLFLHFLADRYCPKEVDPIGNRNWKVNVPKLAGAL